VTLAELLANATPGPWVVVPFTDDYGEQSVYVSMGDADSTVLRGCDAELIALAPDLARLALDMGEALEAVGRYLASYGDTSEAVPRIEALLARLDGIANKDETA